MADRSDFNPGYKFTNDKSDPIGYLRAQEQMVRPSPWRGSRKPVPRGPWFLTRLFACLLQAKEAEIKVATVKAMQDEVRTSEEVPLPVACRCGGAVLWYCTTPVLTSSLCAFPDGLSD